MFGWARSRPPVRLPRGQGDLLLCEVGEQRLANCKPVAANENPPPPPPKEQGGGRLTQVPSLIKSNQPAWLGFFCALTSKQEPRLALYSQAGLCWPPRCGDVLVGWHPAQPGQGLCVGTGWGGWRPAGPQGQSWRGRCPQTSCWLSPSCVKRGVNLHGRCFLLKGMAVSWGTAPTKADQEEEAQPGRSPAASPHEAGTCGHLEVAGISS